ncbi:MAG TPA: nuclear transport factor 2 family protein [Candidatus Eremiobacteraceae bacterium]|nr:nuclear transport factor 2 family protein [Candidatus Eremiobacteraceae bacterium]
MNMQRDAVKTSHRLERFVGVIVFLTVCLACASSAAAQKKKKNQDDTPPTPPPSIMSSAPDETKIDFLIGEFLGAWQLGDVEKMHKDLADDISVVAGTWTPPAVGWPSYLAAYQTQRARMQQVRMDRSNTLIRIAPSGLFAWACYQWDFSALVDGAPMAAEGQTTLVLEKKNDNWVIVHNHTSLVQASQPSVPANPAPQPAASATPTPR